MENIDDHLKFQNGFNRFIDEIIINSKSHGNWPKDVEEAYQDFLDEIEEFDAAMCEDKNLNFHKKKAPAELADIFLSGVILASMMGINIPAEMVDKHNFNLTRPYGHKRNKGA